MTLSRTTRTHLTYQFIILTLMFLGIGYNELLPERKFILFLTFGPMFLYQLIILSCCMELLPVPSWLHFGEPAETKKIDSLSSSPVTSSKPELLKKTATGFVDLSERIHEPQTWEKSAGSLGTDRKTFAAYQRSKSWVNLNDSTKSLNETSLSREGSLDVLPQKTDRKLRSSYVLSKTSRTERDKKARSWKIVNPDIGSSDGKTQPAIKPREQVSTMAQEETELSKSYSFPFRQKRLETWLEMKESSESKSSLNRPYWQSVGYNLAVKYEARRRRRAVSSPTKPSPGIPTNESNSQKSTEMLKQYGKQKKVSSSCINKIKSSFTNFVLKRKEETENVVVNPSKGLKPSLSFKSRNKIISHQTREEDRISKPEFPQFLSIKKPLIFYPKNTPFEEERFENDVQKKMAELEKEQQNEAQPRYQHK